MSFGFSVGDFLAAGLLVKDIVATLRSSARAEYQELIIELHALERALHHLERLKGPPKCDYAVNSIKVAALMCTHVLQDFMGKLKKFEVLSGQHTNAGWLRLWRMKLMWGFTMADEVRNLRAYLAAHVGSINMRLITEGLSSSYMLAESSGEIAQIANDRIDATATIAEGLQSNLQKAVRILTGDIMPQIKALIDQVSRIWQANTQIISMLVKLQEAPAPALHYTWFQAPVKFEDALGRIFPIPSEFDWPKIEAIFAVQFAKGPGREKFMASEYELFDPLNRNRLVTQSTFERLSPGMSLTLAFVVGKYRHALEENDQCLRPGCQSRSFQVERSGAKTCISCGICFDEARSALPLPHRRSLFDMQNEPIGAGTSPKRKRRRDQDSSDDHGRHHDAREERMRYKNMRVANVPLPPTSKLPKCRSFAKLRRRAGSKIHQVDHAKSQETSLTRKTCSRGSRGNTRTSRAFSRKAILAQARRSPPSFSHLVDIEDADLQPSESEECTSLLETNNPIGMQGCYITHSRSSKSREQNLNKGLSMHGDNNSATSIYTEYDPTLHDWEALWLRDETFFSASSTNETSPFEALSTFAASPAPTYWSAPSITTSRSPDDSVVSRDSPYGDVGPDTN